MGKNRAFRGDAAAEGEKRGKGKRVCARVVGVCFYAILAVMVLGTFYISGGNGAPRPIGNHVLMMVLTDSMESTIPKDSVVLVRTNIDTGQINIGDDVTYIRKDKSTVTHRVVAIAENYSDSGMRGFQTKGTDNPIPDPEIVYADNIIGKVEWHSSFIGQVVEFVRVDWMFIAIFFVILLVLNVTLRRYFAHASPSSPSSASNLDNCEPAQ